MAIPRVGVIIPTFNRSGLLTEAIDSVLTQTYTDFEVVVVDDGSTDNTRQVVSAYEDPRVKYVYQQNRGHNAARNNGICHTDAALIAFLDSDDAYLPQKLAVQVAFLEAHPDVGLAGGGFRYVGEDGQFLRDSRPWEIYPDLDTETWLLWSPVMLQAALVRRHWLDAVQGMDETVKVVGDWDFGLRLAYAGCAMAWVEAPVFNYRLHHNQITRDVSQIRRDYLHVLDRFFSQPDVSISLQRLKNQAYAQAYLMSAIRAYEAGQGEDGRSNLDQAITLSPPLIENHGQAIFDQMVGWASNTQAVDPVQLLTFAFDHLPVSAKALEPRRNTALAALEMNRLFAAYESGDLPSVRRSFVRGVSQNPHWLLNRGVLAISVEAFLGGKAAGLGRKLV